MDQFYERRIVGRIDDLRTRLEALLKARKFGTLHVHNVTETLNSKGVEFATPLLVMDVCNPLHAKHVLDATANRIAPLLPCSIALWQDGAEVVVRFLKPTALARFFPDVPSLERVATEVQKAITAAVDELARA
ncbi:MAG: DUF302 domain-containing protein [candidate division WOR-3 bacterium]|nr:DUF302 domain-containing protein [candidate division WOR-3 bacterium]